MEEFGQMPNGDPVHRITLVGGGLTAQLLTYGAVLQDLRLDGHAAPLVLGFDSFAPYLTHSPYFGAIAGRCANRIRGGHLELDGETYQLDQNFLAKHSLHGGAASIGKRLWQVHEDKPDSATLGITLADGEMGFPGKLEVQAQFRLLPGGVLDIVMRATTNAPTLCNLAHHSYFNLDGSATVSDHELRVAAQRYLPVDEELIPTGEQRDVSNTRFDFRAQSPVKQAHPVDHNYCIAPSAGPLRPVATLRARAAGISMECRTTEAGLQIYDGAKIDIDLPGLNGKPMRAHAGLAMEPQNWPDANHHNAFPQSILRPGETYKQHTQYIFSKEEK